jgi:hypothetical protein
MRREREREVDVEVKEEKEQGGADAQGGVCIYTCIPDN